MGPYVTHPQNQSVNITGTFLCPTQTCTCPTLGPELTTAIVYHPRFTSFYGNVELPLVHAHVQSQGDGLVPSPSDTLSYRHDVR